MDTLSLVSKYLKNLEECMDDGDSRVAKEMKFFDALEHKSIVIEVGNQKFAIFTKAPIRAFGEPFMRYSLPCKVDRQGAWDAELDLVDLTNYVTEKVLDSMGFLHVSISDYDRKMVNDVNVEIHGVKFKADFKIRKDTLPNPLIAEYEKRNKKNTITYSIESLGYQGLATWACLMLIKALSIDDEVYHEWVLKFFSRMYFDKAVDKSYLMTEKYIWFRLCGNEHIFTLPEFAVVLGLFMEDEVNHRLFGVHFGKLEVDDRQFDHREYWTKVGKPRLTNHKEVLVKEPLMRIMHKLVVGSLVHRIARTKESSVIYVGHYVTKIANSLRYCVNDEIKKCSKPIDCEYWTTKMLAKELDEKNQSLLKETGIPTQVGIGSGEQRQEPRGGSYGLGGDDYFTSAMPDFGGNSLGYAVGGSSGGAGFNDEDMDE
ncbi:hypothetical protein Tco_0046115 [Tanacetum coccineum]